ncbi:MAG: aminoacyl-tRNA hydrolase [Chitinophagales bacterium]|nr:aminoacyl-tRNA hydrolase [Chitinophagales bacterium]
MKYLIIALGNIGIEYENTRHNIGFKIADEMIKKPGVSFELKRLAFYTEFRLKNKVIHLIKPTTYMNLSGKAMQYWMQELKIPLENTLVLVDDKDLPFGKLRLKAKGSSGGHNGLKNIELVLGSQEYNRLRFGIGNNFSRGKQIDYVLGAWTPKENEELASYIQEAIVAVENFVHLGINKAMELSNSSK